MSSLIFLRTLVFLTRRSGFEQPSESVVSDENDDDENVIITEGMGGGRVFITRRRGSKSGGEGREVAALKSRPRCSQPLRRSTTPALPAAANRTDFYSQGFNLIFSDDSLSRSCPLDPLNFWTRTSCPNFLWSQATKTDKDKDKDKP